MITKKAYLTLAKLIRNLEIPLKDKVKFANQVALVITQESGIWDKKQFISIVKQELE
jgi:hypothetical protein